MTMLAITVRLPWAVAISAGVKLVENRGRAVILKHIGEDVAIHAGAAWDKGGAGDSRILDWWFGPEWIGRRQLDATDFSYHFRNILAVATLIDCHEATTTGRLFGSEPCCPPWGEANHNGKPAFHLVLGNVRRLRKAVPARGSLAVPWTSPADVEAAVREQLAAVPS